VAEIASAHGRKRSTGTWGCPAVDVGAARAIGPRTRPHRRPGRGGAQRPGVGGAGPLAPQSARHPRRPAPRPGRRPGRRRRRPHRLLPDAARPRPGDPQRGRGFPRQRTIHDRVRRDVRRARRRDRPVLPRLRLRGGLARPARRPGPDRGGARDAVRAGHPRPPRRRNGRRSPLRIQERAQHVCGTGFHPRSPGGDETDRRVLLRRHRRRALRRAETARGPRPRTHRFRPVVIERGPRRRSRRWARLPGRGV
jgi:hypothetical protein